MGSHSKAIMMIRTKALLVSLLAFASTSHTSRKRPAPLKCLRGLAMGLALIVAFVSGAQQPEAAGPSIPPPPHHGHRRVTPEDRIKVLARNLNLDQTQQSAVLRILQQRMEETLRIRRDTSISGSDRIEQFRALQDKTVMQVRSVLNEEQKKKYDPLMVRNIGPAADQKSVEDWLELTTPK
jgi:hypothetical protein